MSCGAHIVDGARGTRRGGHQWLSLGAAGLCVCMAALAAPGSAGTTVSPTRCRGAWLVATDTCHVSAPRRECGMLEAQLMRDFFVQGTWPRVVGPYTAFGRTCKFLRDQDMFYAPHADEAIALCASLAGETVRANFGEGRARAKCGQPMFYDKLCTDHVQGAVFSFLFQVEVQTFRTPRRQTQVRDNSGGRFDQQVLHAARYAACRHPANGEEAAASCWADGDAVLTGPGLSADEMLATLGPGAHDVIAVCLTDDAPAIGLSAPMPAALAAAVRAAYAHRADADSGNLAR